MNRFPEQASSAPRKQRLLRRAPGAKPGSGIVDTTVVLALPPRDVWLVLANQINCAVRSNYRQRSTIPSLSKSCSIIESRQRSNVDAACHVAMTIDSRGVAARLLSECFIEAINRSTAKQGCVDLQHTTALWIMDALPNSPNAETSFIQSIDYSVEKRLTFVQRHKG